MQKFSVRLDGRDHARRDVVTTQKPPDFRLDAGPNALGEFPQQAAVEASVESQTLGNRQHNLPVCDRGANFFGHMDCSQQGAFLTGSRDTYSAACRKRRRIPARREWQSGQRTRAKPSCRSPHLRKASRYARPPVSRIRTWPETARRRPGGRTQNARPTTATDRRRADHVADTALTVWSKQAS